MIKGVGILCVLLGHLLPNNHVMKSVIYSFHMPLFFIVTGALLKKEPIKLKVNKKINQIVIQYIIWGLIFANFSFSNLALILYGTNESLIIAGSNGMLWFLVASYIASIIASYFVGNKYIGKSAARLLCIMVGVFGVSLILCKIHNDVNIHGHIMGLPLSLDVSLLSAVFVLYGFIMQKIILPQIKKLQLSKRLLVSIFVLGVAVSIAKKNKGNLGYQQMATFDVGNPVIFTVMAILICTLLVIICEAVMELPISNAIVVRMIMWMGSNSMVIFIVHRTLLYNLKAFCETRETITSYIAAWLILCGYSSILTYIITKITPFLAGKNDKKWR